MKAIYTTTTILFFALFLISTTVAVAQENWVVVKDDCFSYKSLQDPAPEGETNDTWRLRIRSDDDNYMRDVYLKFNIGDAGYAFPEDVELAYLQLTIDRWYNQRGGYYGTFSIYDVGDNSWTEETLTWNNAPWSADNPGDQVVAFEDTIDQIASGDPAVPIYIALSDYVKTQLSQGMTEFSIVLSDTTYGNPVTYNGTDARFFSKECVELGAEKDPDSTFFPYIVLNENPRWLGYDRVVASEDAYVESQDDGGNADNNYGTSWRLWIRGDDTRARVTYLKFNLEEAGYNFSDDVDTALVQLTISRVYDWVGDVDFPIFSFYPVEDNSWSETEITWNNQPWSKEDPGEAFATVKDTIDLITNEETAAKQIWFDVTDYIKNQLDAGNMILSMVLADTSYFNPGFESGTDFRFFATESDTAADARRNPVPGFKPSLFLKGKAGTAIDAHDVPNPSSFQLSQNYPNPFNPNTTISFRIAKSGMVDVAVYDILGRKIRSLLHDVKANGKHQVKWNGLNNSGKPVASGIYFTKVSVNEESKIIKMLLVR